jgi:hypothetical protein
METLSLRLPLALEPLLKPNLPPPFILFIPVSEWLLSLFPVLETFES